MIKSTKLIQKLIIPQLSHLIYQKPTNIFSLRPNFTFSSQRYSKKYSDKQRKLFAQKLEQEMNSTFHRDTWIQVNLSSIKHNVQELKNRLRKDTKIYAVIKANAYGHGDVVVAYSALEAGAEALAVATLDQALKLRRFGYDVPILVMGYSRPEDAGMAADLDISVCVFHKQWLLSASKLNLKRKLKVHLKIDTGMGRLGIRTTEEIQNFLDEFKKTNFQLEGVFTHFSNADAKDLSFYFFQNQLFNKFAKQILQKWDKPIIFHTGNSAASIRFPNDMFNYVRYGISLYGLYPSMQVQNQQLIKLRPALSLYSRIVNCKIIQKGESVSYGRTYKATEDQEWIGTLPIGYADGYRRSLQGQEVLVEGKRMPVVGRVCMDQIMIKLDKEYPIGTKVTLIGKDGQEQVSSDDIAKKLNTINYEVTCMMGSRIPRTYISDQQKIK